VDLASGFSTALPNHLPLVEGWSNDIKAWLYVLLVVYFIRMNDNFLTIATGKSPQNVHRHQDIDGALLVSV
jgi:hypothetical protein